MSPLAHFHLSEKTVKDRIKSKLGFKSLTSTVKRVEVAQPLPWRIKSSGNEAKEKVFSIFSIHDHANEVKPNETKEYFFLTQQLEFSSAALSSELLLFSGGSIKAILLNKTHFFYYTESYRTCYDVSVLEIQNVEEEEPELDHSFYYPAVNKHHNQGHAA